MFSSLFCMAHSGPSSLFALMSEWILLGYFRVLTENCLCPTPSDILRTGNLLFYLLYLLSERTCRREKGLSWGFAQPLLEDPTSCGSSESWYGSGSCTRLTRPNCGWIFSLRGRLFVSQNGPLVKD